MQLTIELPSKAEQLAYNRRRWEELLNDSALAELPFRIETNAHGEILVMPPASLSHSHRANRTLLLLTELLGGIALPECPVSTLDGVRSVDVGWYSDDGFDKVRNQFVAETAPETCVEILSPSNTPSGLEAKKHLYFDAGAKEVWLCDLDGTMRFFDQDAPAPPTGCSAICPDFPLHV